MGLPRGLGICISNRHPADPGVMEPLPHGINEDMLMSLQDLHFGNPYSFESGLWI